MKRGIKTHRMTASALSQAVHRHLTGQSIATPAQAAQGGFSLVEIMLGIAVMSVMGIGAYVVYQNGQNNANIRTEQDNIQQIVKKADSAYGATGGFSTLTTQGAIAAHAVPSRMVQGTDLKNAWDTSVVLSPTNVDGKPAAGMQITYQAVPTKACARLATAVADGMWDIVVNGQSVMDAHKLEPASLVSRCAAVDNPQMVFTYYGGASGLVATNPPPATPPPATPPPATPPPATPPPATPPPATPPPPPACSVAPAPVSQTIACPSGQSGVITQTHGWAAAAAPTCWTPQGWTTVSNTCAPNCVAPPPATQMRAAPPQTQTIACPAGQTGQVNQSRTVTQYRTVNYACPAPTGAYVTSYGGWGTPASTYGPWTTTSKTCTPIVPLTVSGPGFCTVLATMPQGGWVANRPYQTATYTATVGSGWVFDGWSGFQAAYDKVSGNKLTTHIDCFGRRTYTARAHNASTGQTTSWSRTCSCESRNL